MPIRIDREGIHISVRLGPILPQRNKKIERVAIDQPPATEREASADAQTTAPSCGDDVGKYSGIALKGWLSQNYAVSPVETNDNMVIVTGRDFETNSPKFELIPRSYRAARQKRPKHHKEDSGRSVTEIPDSAYRESTSYTGPVIVHAYAELADMLVENGELFIDKNQRLAGKRVVARGNGIAKNLKRMLTAYLHANGIEYDVRIDYRNDGAMLTINPEARAAYNALGQINAGRHY
ncbi:MAG: hypothetical protein HY364_01690 [Candidatus Aenigmarchaeota archaeon]|nr:hypothetical protein [Candidatus Aenigmarchaeota archaeon]